MVNERPGWAMHFAEVHAVGCLDQVRTEDCSDFRDQCPALGMLADCGPRHVALSAAALEAGNWVPCFTGIRLSILASCIA